MTEILFLNERSLKLHWELQYDLRVLVCTAECSVLQRFTPCEPYLSTKILYLSVSSEKGSTSTCFVRGHALNVCSYITCCHSSHRLMTLFTRPKLLRYWTQLSWTEDMHFHDISFSFHFFTFLFNYFYVNSCHFIFYFIFI